MTTIRRFSYLFIFLIFSCNQASTEKNNSEDQLKFDTNVANFNSMIVHFPMKIMNNL